MSNSVLNGQKTVKTLIEERGMVAYKGSPKYALEQMKTQKTFEEMDTEEREWCFHGL